MSRKFIAAILAVSTTLAAFSAAPARAASEEDIAKILGAAATIFIIGKAIENSRDKKDDKKKRTVTHASKPVVQFYQNNQVRAHKKNSIPQVVPRNTQRTRAALPRRCVRQVSGAHVRRVVMQPCLSRHYRSARALPRKCEMTVATQRGHRRAYALPCLRQRGYQVARN